MNEMDWGVTVLYRCLLTGTHKVYKVKELNGSYLVYLKGTRGFEHSLRIPLHPSDNYSENLTALYNNLGWEDDEH